MVEPNIDVQRLMHEIRENVARKQPSADESKPPSHGPTNGDPGFASHYHVDDLLRFHGEDFVRNAYRALLCREPDEPGMSHHLQQLASGRFNKLDVLDSLHRSAEGRSSQVKLTGLALPIAVRRLGRIPVVGYVIRLLVGIARLPRLVQHQNRYEFYNWSQQQRIVARQDEQHQELSSAIQQVSAQVLEATQRAAELHQAGTLFLRRYEELAANYAELESRLIETRKYIDQSQLDLSEKSQQLLNQSQQQAVQLGQQLAIQQQQLSRQIDDRVQPLLQRQQKADADLLMQERRLTVLLEQVGRRGASSSDPALIAVTAAEESHLLDALYAAFEDQFRGPRDEVTRRLQVYIPILKEAQISIDVLDLGSGRGEWLHLLSAEGIEGRGVDRNRILVEECRRLGLNVIEQDALAELRSLPPESLNAVTAFHLVEHLPFETLIKLLDEIARTLRPGGMLILETPNPENFMVGSCSFYADPTHRNPIPSQTLKFLLEARGFTGATVLKLRPWDEAKIDGDSEIVKRFNEYFYGAPDYGIVARKP
jgi:O-antigen chain-terminating methyltransferase